MIGRGQPSTHFNTATCPIIARHWFGVGPLRPIGIVTLPVIQRFESLREVANVPA